MTDKVFESTDSAVLSEGDNPQEMFEKRLRDKDEHIKKLEKEAADARAVASDALAKRAEDLEKFVKSTQNSSANPAGALGSRQAVEPAPATSSEDLEQRTREVIERVSREDQLKRNVNHVVERLVEVYGSEEKANQAVRARAAELGVSTKFLQDTAGVSPTAFFTQMGVSDDSKVAPKATPSNHSPRVNTAALNGKQTNGEPEPGTYKWYQRLLETNRNQYMSAKIQTQMHKDAMAKGDAFFV